jgi:hypothetical protein
MAHAAAAALFLKCQAGWLWAFLPWRAGWFSTFAGGRWLKKGGFHEYSSENDGYCRTLALAAYGGGSRGANM